MGFLYFIVFFYELLFQPYKKTPTTQPHQQNGPRQARRCCQAQGCQEGYQEGRQEGHQEGRQEGYQEGRQEGHQEGRQEGWCQEGRRQEDHHQEDRQEVNNNLKSTTNNFLFLRLHFFFLFCSHRSQKK